MKKIISLVMSLVLAISLFSCKQNKEESTEPAIEAVAIDITDYESFGEEFGLDNPLSSESMREVYDNLKVGDSIEVSFLTKINSVCQNKGCWMRLDLGEDDQESFVKFKDYGFFMPKDAGDGEAIVKGIAFKAETSVASLRHYAEDAGKSAEEIEAITEPKIEYSFIADGVLLKK